MLRRCCHYTFAFSHHRPLKNGIFKTNTLTHTHTHGDIERDTKAFRNDGIYLIFLESLECFERMSTHSQPTPCILLPFFSSSFSLYFYSHAPFLYLADGRLWHTNVGDRIRVESDTSKMMTA